jgi:hypothetical protein
MFRHAFELTGRYLVSPLSDFALHFRCHRSAEHLHYLTHAQVQAQLEYPVYVNEHLFAAAAEGDG